MFTTTQRTSIVVAIACAVAVAAGASTARAEKFSFGVMGDTQWTGMQAGVFGGENTVSTAIARAVNDQFVSHGVKFVIQTGDLTDTTGEPALQRRLIANEALYNNGIAFFGLRGNHESDNETSYPGANSYFKNNYIPGSAGYANYSAALSGASVSVAPDGMSYSVTYNGTKVVLLDYNAASGTMTGPTGTNAAITWLGSELPSNALDRNYEQAFVFQHKNILGQNHKDNMFGSNNTANVDVRDSFIKTLADGGVRYNVSGHDHMHYRSLITTQDGLASITQQISASCSTKFYTPDAPYSGFDTPIAQQLYSIGYYVYTIDGPLVTVDFYATSHLNNGTGSNNSNLYLRLENGNITTTETPVWIRSETFGYSLNGKRFLVESGESLSGVTDTSPFAAQTTMSLGGNNTSEVQTRDYQGGGTEAAVRNDPRDAAVGRNVTKDINTGWTELTSENAKVTVNTQKYNLISDILTIWGLEDCGDYMVEGNIAVPLAATAVTFDLTLSYDALSYSNPHMLQQDRDGNWLLVDFFELNLDGSVTGYNLMSLGGLGVFALGMAVPEPASLSVLALGGLALIARRRKA